MLCEGILGIALLLVVAPLMLADELHVLPAIGRAQPHVQHGELHSQPRSSRSAPEEAQEDLRAWRLRDFGGWRTRGVFAQERLAQELTEKAPKKMF